MTISELLGDLRERGIVLACEGDELIVRSLKRALDPALLEALRANKPALRELIQSGAYAAAMAAPPPGLLVTLSRAQVDAIVATVPGGAANLQDVYPLAPLQEGILFHHLMTKEGDPYLSPSLYRFDRRERLDAYLFALQAVVDRHDILRTAVLWEGLPEPLQVVWRKAPLAVEEVERDPSAGNAEEQLHARFDPRHHRIELDEAPMIRACVVRDEADDSWLLLLLRHHLVSDHATLDVLQSEIQAHLEGRADSLPTPLPFRTYVAQTRLGASQDEHRAFFTGMLGDVDEPTTPFGLSDVRGDWSGMEEARLDVDARLATRVRARARSLGVSAASVFHVAWAQVLARASGRSDVVFGTLLFGRMRGGEGSDRVMGPFINTLPIRVRVGNVGVAASVRQTHALLAKLLHHEHASLALAQRCSGVDAPAPLFTSLLNYRHSAGTSRAVAAPPAIDGMRSIYARERTNYPLAMSVDDLTAARGEDGGFRLKAQVICEFLDPARVCGLVHRTLEGLVEALERAPERTVDSIDVLPERERSRVLDEWNRTAAAYPGESCVHELFEAHVARAPEAMAVVFEGEHVTYGDLNRRANRLAHHLRALGVGPDVRVAICVERSLAMVVGLLGVLKAGGAYVPLDPNYPAERLAYMLSDSAPVAVLTQRDLRERIALAGVPVLELDATAPAWTARSSTNPARGALTPAHLTCVIYTSGSTGRPKGVMFAHRGLTNLVTMRLRDFEPGPDSRVMQFASFSFDACVFEVAMTLFRGAVLCLPNETRVVGDTLARLAEQHRITHAVLPQSLLAALPDSATLRSIRSLITTGEAPTTTLIDRWRKDRQLINGYGPTETTICATVYAYPAGAVSPTCIGTPIANTRVYVLDEDGAPVPVGVAGELYLGGVNVARGYLGRPSLTAERFVADPYGGEPGARLYRTGDLGRWRSDGTLEFLGRTDHQVKVRGFRIELGEIEARLAEHPGVREAVVVAREDTPGEKRLVAYVVGDEPVGFQTTGAEALRAHLSERLPSYMVPAAYVRLDALPLTPNGKLDRKALPVPEDEAYAVQAYAAPVGEVEQALAEIWAEVLGIERVGRHDNFFELGGHSLLVVRVIGRMRQRGLHAEVRALFTAPTLAALAAEVGGDSRDVDVPANAIPVGCDAITPSMLPLVSLDQTDIDAIVATVPGGAANVQDIYPLAPLQEGILFHHLMAKDGDPYLTASLFSFASRTGLDRYLSAFQAIVDRHDILRTAVVWEGLRQPVQVVWRRAPLPIEEVELEEVMLEEMTREAAEADARKRLYARFDPRRHRIDVREAPLMRAHIARDAANDRWLLLLLRHHFVIDHTTLEVLQSEIKAHLNGRADSLPAPLPFRNYVAQTRLGVSQEEHRAFFTELLGDVDEPTTPFGLTDVQGDGADMKEARFNVDDTLAVRLRERARALGVSAASIVHVAWAQVLARASGRADVVFGTLLLGRMQGGAGADRVMGLFINTLPIRVRVGNVGVAASMRQTHAVLAKLLHHEHSSLALAQRCSGVEAPAPLFTALLNYRHGLAKTLLHAPAAAPHTAIDEMTIVYGEERTNYPLTLSVDDLGAADDGGFRLKAQVLSESLDPIRICGFMHRALEGVVEALEKTPERIVSRIDVLPASERSQVLDEWNRIEAYPAESCIHERFDAQAARTPDATALTFDGRHVTYGELNRRANRLAHHLRSIGVGPDVRVGLCVERGVEMIVGLLAVLKAGGAYVSMDPSYPAERLAYMLADSAPVAVLTQKDLRGRIARVDVPVIDLDSASLEGDAPVWIDQPMTNPARADLTTAHLAYVIYTSGSTGQPKGVLVPHGNVARLFTATDRWFQFGAADVWTLFHSVSFDFSVWEIWGALFYGGRLVIVPQEIARSPEAFHELVCDEGVTLLNQTPSAFYPFMKVQASSDREHRLRHVIFGGEALDVPMLRQWFTRNGDACPRLVNMYGITETTVHVTWRPLAWSDVERAGASPIGERIPDLRTYLLDPEGELVPVGVAGELYVGGAGVARGYLGRPALTAERFLADPYGSDSNGGEPGARLYRTGDLGRWRSDGTLEYLGRTDHQVKVRGFRIELGEIEARLVDHPGVREAVVLARQDTPGDTRLVAYVIGDETSHETPGADALRAHLSGTLPSYMVPAAYVRLEWWPLTAHGKLDRKALPVPEDEAYAVQAYAAPAGEAERALAEIWSEVLGIERVGRHDNFFELGGHSLLVVRVIARMRQRGLHAEVRALFTAPTLAALAVEVDGDSHDVDVPANAIPAGCEAIAPAMLPLVWLDQADIDAIVATVPGGAANVQDIYPLAPLQEGILFHHLITTEGDPYLLAFLNSFETRTDLDRYLSALQAVVDRHDILRTAVLWEGLRQPVQVVWRRAPLCIEEVALEEAERDPAQDAARKQLYARFDPRHHRIDVRQAPLMRVHVARDAASDRWLFLLLRHHLIIDHTATEVLRDEIDAHLNGQSDHLPSPLPFRNYVAQARMGASQDEHRAFFTELLGDVDEPTAPFGLLDVRGDGCGIDEARLWMDGPFTTRLRERARALGVSAATLCHVAWAQVLARVSGRDDVVFGTLLFGRMHAGEGADRVMGPFINTLPVRIRVAGAGVEAGAKASVQATHALLAKLLRYEHASLALAQRCSAVEAPAPLFTSLLNYRHTRVRARAAAAGPASDGMRRIYAEERSNYPLTMSVDDLGDEVCLTTKVKSQVDASRVCALMRTALEGLVEALEIAPARPLGRIEVLPASERARVLEEWNRTDADYPRELCIHHLFEAQAARTPDAPALVYEGRRLTYAELNARANRLAHHLIARGVGPDVCVGLCLERSPAMIEGVLAVLKAGGVYVALDPEYPEERLRYMLADCAPAALLVHASLADRFATMDIATIAIDRDAVAWAGRAETNPDRRGLTPEHLAYVIYTSGSTGQPKGVMNEHRTLVNRVVWARRAWGLTAADVVLCMTPLTFDGSVREIFLPLSSGSRVVVARPGGHRDPAYLVDTIRDQGITTVNQVPSLLQLLVEEAGLRECPLVRQVMCGGEAIAPALVERLRERLPGVQLRNVYGPSEAATALTVIDCMGHAGGSMVPVGRPSANTRAYVLDRRGAPAPIGVAGELYIGGAGVGRGYVGRAAMTAERFLPDPFSVAPGARLYCTGDLVRWLADGQIEFLGRNDFQVKVRGQRVEPGEVEARLSSHPHVREAVVMAREHGPGGQRLVAYYVASGNVDAESLRAHLLERLPDYMVPAAYVRLEQFPLMPNGKLDRKALPAPADDAYARRGYEAPADETEQALAEIWSEVLGIERVGRHDNFFDLGGHSLLAVQVISRVRQVLEVDVALIGLFAHPLLEDFAQEIVDAQLAQFDPDEVAQLAALLRGSIAG